MSSRCGWSSAARPAAAPACAWQLQQQWPRAHRMRRIIPAWDNSTAPPARRRRRPWRCGRGRPLALGTLSGVLGIDAEAHLPERKHGHERLPLARSQRWQVCCRKSCAQRLASTHMMPRRRKNRSHVAHMHSRAVAASRRRKHESICGHRVEASPQARRFAIWHFLAWSPGRMHSGPPRGCWSDLNIGFDTGPFRYVFRSGTRPEV